MSKEVLKLSLDALEHWDVHGKLHQPTEEAITALREALAEQPAQGCNYCNHALYSGTKCKNCGRVTEQAAIKRDLTPEQLAQQEPVAKLQVTLQDRPIDIELAQYKRMFESACSALGAIGDALGCDPEEGGAEPILAAIAELKATPPAAPVQEPVAWMCHPFGDTEVEFSSHQECENCIPLYTTPPAQPAPVQPVAYLCENAVGHKYFRWKKPSSTFKPIALYTTPPVAQPAVPDAIHHTDLSEHPQYIEGWNDCRAEMLKGMKP